MINELQDKLSYQFSNPPLLAQALTHTSHGNEHNIHNNERLEFLGDSVLGMIVSDYLYNQYPGINEGKLTKLRAEVVNAKSLLEIAKALELGQFLSLGRGEEQTGGRDRASNLVDALEAVIGAVYLDSCFERARQVILVLFRDKLEGLQIENMKGRLLEFCQKRKMAPRYRVLAESGSAHEKIFTVGVTVGSATGIGEGKSKRMAEKMAAKALLEKIQDSSEEGIGPPDARDP